jgi:hypothetical protein
LYLQHQFPENTIKPVSNHEGTKTQKTQTKKQKQQAQKTRKERTTLFLSSFLPNPAALWNPTCLNNVIPGSITTSNSSATPQKEKGKNKRDHHHHQKNKTGGA